ncbi:helix-turn-helix domain-containing protein [Streptomyces sp. NPDC001275]
MPVAARPVSLTAAERRRLTKTAWGHKTEFRARLRAQIVLLAARGHSNAAISWHLGVHPDTGRTWRDRFAAQGLAGLEDRKRSGRPKTTPHLQRHQRMWHDDTFVNESLKWRIQAQA